ncbi:MAG: hypothetical protein QMC95_06250 [Desulfitobacteriaceae bacterium]|nr:hypothetical protein [Desulfitobacteriaceae bacterium]MDI6913806.1 hypothetical protein [Desulfitobacteriaceae bacterium]
MLQRFSRAGNAPRAPKRTLKRAGTKLCGRLVPQTVGRRSGRAPLPIEPRTAREPPVEVLAEAAPTKDDFTAEDMRQFTPPTHNRA